MKISDEVMRIALAECEHEPIQIPGAIQSHGLLFALRGTDLTILQVSENVFDMLGIESSELLHQPLSVVMDTRPVELASYKLGEKTPRLLNPIPIEIRARGSILKFEGILHRSGRIFVLELEKHVEEKKGYGGLAGFYESIRDVSTQIMQSDSLDDVLRNSCAEIRKFTEFSRVLIYKFDEDWNGTVIAESRSDHLPSLMDHRFPASDIPKQARDLYTVNWLRIIPDVDYVPSRLVPLHNPMTDRALDMSHSVLRSVSPVHLEYMRNMGQRASMSVSLLKGGKLWGLISCHHEAPKFLRYDTRVAAEFVGQIVSSQIVAREDSAEVEHRLQLKGIYDQLLRKGGSFEDIPHVLVANASLFLSLTNSQGAALFFGGEVRLIGRTPTREQVKDICKWIHERDDVVFHTDELSRDYAPARALHHLAAGVLALRIPNAPTDTVIWFRPEMNEQIVWSGNPNLSKEISSSGKIEPRKSFAAWHEQVAGRSTKWKRAEVEAADELRLVIMGMAGRLTYAGDSGDHRSAFRSSLADSIATTEASNIEAPATFVRSSGSALLDGFTDIAVLFLDQDGLIQEWSVGAQHILGYDASDAIGRTLDMFLVADPGVASKHASLVSQAENLTRVEEELWLSRSNGTILWGKLIVKAIRGEPEKGIAGFSVVIQDVTKEKAAEEELRSTKLSAEAANKAKSIFLANISHEIRTPLGAVLGFAELLGLENQSAAERAELSARISKNGIQLTTLINDLLDLSKAESGRLEVENIQFELPQLLNDVHQTLNFKASEKSILFEVLVSGEVPSYLVSDPTRLRQIVINLIGNAIKFTEPGGRVTLTCLTATIAGSKKVLFRVTDTGRGMDENEMSRLFQPFAQADVSTTRRYGGSGLGLFISQKLARSLGGDLKIEGSTRDFGSSFVAYVDPGSPTNLEVFTTLEAGEKHVVLNRIVNDELNGIRVLVIDDSPDNRQLIKVFLSMAGAIVETANDGKSGSQKALNGNFDAVLMDVQMPIMDGNAAMRILRELDYAKPVIALTAHAMNDEREYSLTLGFKDYLTKPINRETLIRTIREVVDTSRKAEALL